MQDLLHEGSVRRITVKNDQGHTILEIPVTAGVVVAVVAKDFQPWPRHESGASMGLRTPILPEGHS